MGALSQKNLKIDDSRIFSLLKIDSSLSKEPRDNNDPPPKFLVDGMLGSLATKLRILGFDTVFDKTSEDRELIRVSQGSSRILVTSDQELYLHARQRKISTILITRMGDRERLVELCLNLGMLRLDLTRPSRCSFCNSSLRDTGRRDNIGRPKFECSGCGKLYWRGSHWKKLDELFHMVNDSLSHKRRTRPNK